MKKVVISAVTFLVGFLTYSQTYQGIVRDVQGKPIAFANVIALNNNNELISGVITDKDGGFEILVNTKESFVIVISFIGYEDWKKEISKAGDMGLGMITLQESKNELEEVVITARRPTIKRKVDRLVFNIENSVVASGGDAVDILRRTPGVRVKGE